jgi:hypothetical protein
MTETRLLLKRSHRDERGVLRVAPVRKLVHSLLVAHIPSPIVLRDLRLGYIVRRLPLLVLAPVRVRPAVHVAVSVVLRVGTRVLVVQQAVRRAVQPRGEVVAAGERRRDRVGPAEQAQSETITGGGGRR